MVAADTSLSQGYSIHTRNCSKASGNEKDWSGGFEAFHLAEAAEAMKSSDGRENTFAFSGDNFAHAFIRQVTGVKGLSPLRSFHNVCQLMIVLYSNVFLQVTRLTDKCVIASCGMKSDAITLHKHLKARLV